MTRIRAFLAISSIAAVAALGGASALAASEHTTIDLRKTSLGKILVNSKGFTIYAFTRDTRNHDSCMKLAGCAQVWMPVTTVGKPLAGRGVKASLLGSITVKGLATGQRQVTYAGHPLYTYLGDAQPGETSYVNFASYGGHWVALNAGGHEVK